MTEKSASTLLAHLRESIRSTHHRLNRHPLLAALLETELSVSDYLKALAALHGAQAALEGAITAGLAEHGTAYDFRPRLPDLEQELAFWQRSPLPLRIALELPVANHPATLIGLLYVAEGSRLGGELIAQRLMKSLPSNLSQGFFREGKAQETWANYCRHAETNCRTTDYPRAASAALAAFSAYLNHLDDCLAQLA